MELTAKTGSAIKHRLAIVDKVGTCISLTCAVHCMALPLIITILPFMGLGFLAGGTFEFGMIFFSLTLATMSLCWGTRIHGNRQILLFILAALIFFLTGHSIESHWHWIFMAVGGTSLAFGHILNNRLCRSCPDCSGH